jgi:membrane associated rhomboid family serine protease
VVKAQRASAGVFVVYSLFNGARYGGIDNAAHLGGLVGGFAMELILTRPLNADRNHKQWTGSGLQRSALLDAPPHCSRT